MQKEAKASVILLERLHISKREMASIDMAEVVRTYCENLDGAKMYFTEPSGEREPATSGLAGITLVVTTAVSIILGLVASPFLSTFRSWW
jgi:hypothetical protein